MANLTVEACPPGSNGMRITNFSITAIRDFAAKICQCVRTLTQEKQKTQDAPSSTIRVCSLQEA